jgi:hypothetical protein
MHISGIIINVNKVKRLSIFVFAFFIIGNSMYLWLDPYFVESALSGKTRTQY